MTPLLHAVPSQGASRMPLYYELEMIILFFALFFRNYSVEATFCAVNDRFASDGCCGAAASLPLPLGEVARRSAGAERAIASPLSHAFGVPALPKGEPRAAQRNDHLYETLEVQLNRYLISILYPNSTRMARGQRKIFCEFFVNFSSMHRKRGTEWALVHGKVTAKRKPVRDEFGNVHNLFILRDFITGILNPEFIFHSEMK